MSEQESDTIKAVEELNGGSLEADAPEDIHYEESGREPGSLASRVERRSQELQSRVSEVFPIPTWEDILAVELRLVGWEALRRIITKHERQRAEAIRELYVAVDQLLLGTVQFFEINPEDNSRQEVEQTWISLARATGKVLPDSLTPRQAVIALVGDTNALILWREWQEWMATRRGEVDGEVAEDFGSTP